MKHLDLDLTSPAENLAADEALLDWCEAGAGEEILLFWEPCETFVVVGYANKIATEVNVAACAQKNVPIFRRCSGGGTIVQMAGGLNYSLILRIEESGPTRNITSANQFIMERNRQAIETGFGSQNSGARISVRGHTDLTLVTDRSSLITEKKFAGNSQRRRKNFLLFHGTLLLNCDLALVSELLAMPSLQPDYRASRPHAEFVTNLPLPAETVKTALIQGWNAGESLENPPRENIAKLAREKYATTEWNFKF
ncbi:MAG TPA: lipoate--protein ligase family protein [Verrucomicrobiae bacterium]|jgi:lipoate-protein ligase A